MEEPVVPVDIKARYDTWFSLWKNSVKIYYGFGVLGVGSSAFAAAVGGDVARYLAAVSGVCIAVLGFVAPEKRYLKFVRAWRILDMALMKFKLGKATIDDLIASVDKGEALITEFEEQNQ